MSLWLGFAGLKASGLDWGFKASLLGMFRALWGFWSFIYDMVWGVWAVSGVRSLNLVFRVQHRSHRVLGYLSA